MHKTAFLRSLGFGFKCGEKHWNTEKPKQFFFKFHHSNLKALRSTWYIRWYTTRGLAIKFCTKNLLITCKQFLVIFSPLANLEPNAQETAQRTYILNTLQGHILHFLIQGQYRCPYPCRRSVRQWKNDRLSVVAKLSSSKVLWNKYGIILTCVRIQARSNCSKTFSFFVILYFQGWPGPWENQENQRENKSRDKGEKGERKKNEVHMLSLLPG